MGEDGLLEKGVFDEVVYLDDVGSMPNQARVTAALVSLGYWDWLANDGRCYRPLPIRHHMPLHYTTGLMGLSGKTM